MSHPRCRGAATVVVVAVGASYGAGIAGWHFVGGIVRVVTEDFTEQLETFDLVHFLLCRACRR